MEKYFIVVAGGKGSRMGGDIPKQFQLLQGVPILFHTLKRLHSFVPDATIVLVIPQAHLSLWQQLVATYGMPAPLQVAYGGANRFESVRNGLNQINSDNDALVAVHDGVRPFVSREVVFRCFDAAALSGAVIPTIRPVETIRLSDADGRSHVFPRRHCHLVQTPQVFRLPLLRKAYLQEYRETFTDDASVVESMGHPIEMVEGNIENIKLTTPFDILLAESLVNNK